MAKKTKPSANNPWNVKPAKKKGHGLKTKHCCPVAGCGKEFGHEHRYRAHYMRSHSEEFRDHMKAARKRAKTKAAKPKTDAPTSPKSKKRSSGKDILQLAQIVLKRVSKPLPLSVLVDGIRRAGYVGPMSNGSIGTYLSQLVNQNPDSGITRPARGVYAFTQTASPEPVATPEPAKQEHATPSATATATANRPKTYRTETTAKIDMLELEIARLKEAGNRKQELLMKMMEVVMLAASDG